MKLPLFVLIQANEVPFPPSVEHSSNTLLSTLPLPSPCPVYTFPIPSHSLLFPENPQEMSCERRNI